MKTVLLPLAQKSLEQWMCKLENSPFHSHPLPEVMLNQRGRIAGSAILQQNIIKLHPKLFEQNQAHFLSDVIPHELAHLLVYRYFGRVKPHGREWRQVMTQVLGVPAEVRHRLDVTNIGIKTFAYHCACDTMLLSAVRHNRIRSGKQRYHCTKCREALQFSENEKA
jgi:SprT protein